MRSAQHERRIANVVVPAFLWIAIFPADSGNISMNSCCEQPISTGLFLGDEICDRAGEAAYDQRSKRKNHQVRVNSLQQPRH